MIVTAAFSAVNERELRRRRYDLEALAKFSLRLESVTKGSDVGGDPQSSKSPTSSASSGS